MAEKKRSAITRITLNTATFKGETFEPACINLFFGRNGTGKSSIAHSIEDGRGAEWKVGESPDHYNLLIYNQEFIDENFESFDHLQGVFTIDKTNIRIQQKIDILGAEKDRAADEMARLIEAGKKKKAEKESLLTRLQNECWSRSAEIRADFDATQSGRKRKNTFTEKILSSNPAEHDLGELKELYDAAYDSDSHSYGLLKKSEEAFGRYDLSGAELMGRPIISSSNTSFAVFMRALGATDWVKNGHAHYVKNAEGRCPFCQQKLPYNFEHEIASCFDEQYQNDLSALSEFQSAYKGWTQSVLDVFEGNLTSGFPRIEIESYKEKVTHLKTVITANLRQIEKKLDKPALETELEDIEPLIMEIDAVTDGFNRQIAAHNTIVNSRRSKKKECENALWEYLARMLEKEVREYRSSLKAAEEELAALGTEYRTRRERAAQIQTEISRLSGQTINTSEAVDNINRLLKGSGFQGFSLRERKNQRDVYEVIRENGETAQKLSEGERNFLAFLYFYQLVRGSGRAGSAADSRDKIVVMDDPVSGMDGNTLFIVSSLVRGMIEVCGNNLNHAGRLTDGSAVRQIFILTHNADFHREISYNLAGKYESVSFFMIRKNDNVSEIEECVNKPKSELEGPTNRNPVQNSYTALWEEYMTLNSSIPLLNVIRRILDHYFIQFCGYKESEIRKTILEENKDAFTEEDQNGRRDYTGLQLAAAMLSGIGRAEGFADGFCLVEDCRDAGKYRRVLELIFDRLGQKQHFDLMTGKKSEGSGGQGYD